MAGKQLEKVLKTIERQLLKLVLSHAFNLASLSVRLSCIVKRHSKSPHSPSLNFECEELQYKKKLYKKQPFKSPTLRSLATESVRLVLTRKKALKSHQGNYTT